MFGSCIALADVQMAISFSVWVIPNTSCFVLIDRLQESRLWFHPSGSRSDPPQPLIRRLTLYNEHRLPILLFRPTSVMVVHDNLHSHENRSSIQRSPLIPPAQNHYRSCPHGRIPTLYMDNGRYLQSTEHNLSYRLVCDRMVF